VLARFHGYTSGHFYPLSSIGYATVGKNPRLCLPKTCSGSPQRNSATAQDLPQYQFARDKKEILFDVLHDELANYKAGKLGAVGRKESVRDFPSARMQSEKATTGLLVL
jgi:hypothetical protein